MSKANDKSESDEDLDLFEGDEGLDSDLELDLMDDSVEEAAPKDSEAVSVNVPSLKASAKLETKRLLDDYLERKWFRDHGWEDDDELFNDEFFSDDSKPIHHHA